VTDGPFAAHIVLVSGSSPEHFRPDPGGREGQFARLAACRVRSSLGVTQSMGSVGSCFVNAASESFHSTLEYELLRKHHFATRAAARVAVAACIDRYNRTRRHSSCEMRSPIEFEVILATQTVTAEEAASNPASTIAVEPRAHIGWHQTPGR
jgi:hypothetical protein